MRRSEPPEDWFPSEGPLHPNEPGAPDEPPPVSGADREDDDGRPRPSKATVLTDLVVTGAELWHSPDGAGYATVELDGQREHLAIRSRPFQRWASRLYRACEGRVPPAAVLADAVNAVEGEAIFAGAEHSVHVRLAGSPETIYLDIGDPDRSVVTITARGWRMTKNPRVRLVRRRGTRALPKPVRGATLDELRELHPALADEQLRVLVASWLVSCLRPWASYAVLSVIGEHGSGKSWLARQLLRIVDPTEAELRSPPRDTRDLAAAIRAGHVVALDNLGRIQPWLSDALCVTSTGGTFATRELYTDSEEHLVRARQPVIVTSIAEVIAASDLRDRALVIRIPPLTDEKRIAEAKLAERLHGLAARLLGALCDAAVRGLRNFGQSDGATVHRLADHVGWAMACGVAAPGIVEQAHRAQRDQATADQLADPMGQALMQLPDPVWTGTMTELLAALEQLIPDGERGRQWPRHARGMGSALRRLAPALRREGFEVVEGDGYGPRKNNRGAFLRGPGATSGTSATSGQSEIIEQRAPTSTGDSIADVGTSGRRRARNTNHQRRSDVADVPDVAPGRSDLNDRRRAGRRTDPPDLGGSA